MCHSTYGWEQNRCANCPRTKLVTLRIDSKAGELLSKVLELDHAFATYKIDWHDMPCDIGEAYKVWTQQRQIRDNELAAKHRQDIERERMRQQMSRR